MPEIKTVEGWITRYSASSRKESAEQRVIEPNKRLEEDSNGKNNHKRQKR